jgi:hypothetical protein
MKMGDMCVRVVRICQQTECSLFEPFKDEAQTALFKDPVRTAL